MSKRRQRNKVPYIKPVPTKAISSTLVDIITPVYGRFDLLKRCLESIPAAAKDISYHIILIDNNSPNKEEADVFYNEIKIQKNTRIVRNKENLGFPKACNQAVRLSHSPLLFFLNSDVTLFEDAIKNLVLAMDDPNNGAVGMKLLFPPDTESGPDGKVQHIGLYTNINGAFDHLFIGWSPDNPKVKAVNEVLAVTGAAFMTRRALYTQLGGFDEVYGGGTYEDVDYCLRLRLSGKTILVEQKAVGYHYTGASARTYQVGFPLNQNKALFDARWGGKYPWTAWLHA